MIALLVVAQAASSVAAPKKKQSKQANGAVEDDKLTVETIFRDGALNAKGYDAKWVDGERAFWRWKDSAGEQGGRDLVKVDALTGDEQVVVEARHLIPPGESQPLPVESYELSSNLDKLLIYTNSKRVWRRNTRGDYWVLDRSTGALSRLGGDAPTSSLMFAKFSPDGRSVAYVRERNIYIEPLLAGTPIRQVTHAESPDVINGTFDWVYEEELSARDGFRWSPDGKSIVYWKLVTTRVPKFTMINNTDGFYPKTIEFAYPKTGQTNADCQVYAYDLATNAHQRLSIPGDPREHYLCRMEWIDDTEIVVQQLNRRQNKLRVYRVNPYANSRELMLVEKDDAWINVHDEMYWTKDRTKFTWISERDGWRHIYLASRDGTDPVCVTPGEYDVIRLLKFDEESNRIYFLASPENPTQQYLYEVHLDGSGVKRLSPAKQTGSHSYSIETGGKLAIHTHSRFGKPPKTNLVKLPSHDVVKKLETNRDLRKKLKKLKLGEPRLFRTSIRVDDEQLAIDGWMVRPPNFDPNRKYPLIVHVYGEPAGQTVLDRWMGSGYLWHQLLAQHGYIVVSFDNRGTPAPRGRAWRKSVYRQVGILAPKDQAASLRQLLNEHEYIDRERVGVWGWSGGGSMTLNAMFKFPELYHAGISIAPVPNQRHYDTIYQERYMGLPSENVDGYLMGSPIHFAKQLEGHLLVVHGTGDDNCHYQTTEALINELIQHNRPFEMMAYPNRTHSIREGHGTTLHLRSLMTRYFLEKLPPTLE